MVSLFSGFTETAKNEAIRDLIHDASPSPTFFLFTGLSIVMATIGLVLNNNAVVIGSMLIAPLLSPILSLSLGVVMADSKIILHSLFTLVKASAVSIAVAALVVLFLPIDHSPFGAEIMSRTHPSLAYLAIAVTAGIAVGIAKVNQEMSELLPGVAISVALIPPLAVVGIGMARLDWAIISGAFSLYLVNIIGIVFATMIVFSMMNFYIKRSLAQHALTKEESALKENNSK